MIVCTALPLENPVLGLLTLSPLKQENNPQYNLRVFLVRRKATNTINPCELLRIMKGYHAQVVPTKIAMNPNIHGNGVVIKMAIFNRKKGILSPDVLSLLCWREAVIM